MIIKIDENLPIDIVKAIRSAGHGADTVGDQGLAGADDATLLAKFQLEGRAIFTLDKGIGYIRKYPPAQFAGIVVFRPRSTDPGYTLSFLLKHLPALLQSDLSGHLVIVSERGVRTR
jgi:hypothetical protein